MHLIKDTDTLQKYVRINTDVLKESFLPYEREAREIYLRPYLGEDLLKDLLGLADETPSYPEWADTDEKKKLLTECLALARASHARFMLHQAAPHLDLHLSEMGFVVTHNTQQSPASAERVRKATEAFLEQGYANLEILLRFLDKNNGEIDSYKDSPAYLRATRNLVNSCELFDSIVNIEGSRLRFLSWQPVMDHIETMHVEPLISLELTDELRRQQREKAVSPANKALLIFLHRAIVHLTMAEAPEVAHLKPMDVDKERHKDYGRNYLARVKQLLDAKPDDYPEYKTSSSYVVKRQYESFQNTSDSPTFVFGQPSTT